MFVFDVSEDGLEVNFVARVSYYPDGLREMAEKLLTFGPEDGEPLVPPLPRGGLY
jgi:hypothetical protein